MKNPVPKFLRSASKARTWYGFALLLCFGLLLVSGRADAALTSPAPVVTGTKYGQDNNLGKREATSVDEDGLAYTSGQSKNRRVLYVEPTGGEKMLVVAFVNTSDSISGCSGGTPTCRLEFRVSTDDGLTWGQALLGSTPYLPIRGPKYDYTLYPDPNGQDIWVAYTDSVVNVALSQTFTNSTIQKLVLDPTSKTHWTLGPSARPKLPSEVCNGGYSPPQVSYTDPAAHAVVGVQVSGSTSRVWGILARSCTFSAVAARYAQLVYRDTANFDNGADWTVGGLVTDTVGGTVGRTRLFLDALDGWQATEYGAETKAVFVPTGTKKLPTLVRSNARRMLGCNNLDFYASGPNPNGLSIIALGDDDGTTFQWQTVTLATPPDTSPFPFYYTQATAACSGDPVKSLITGTPATDKYPFDFSAAALPDVPNPNKARFVIAYEGGVDSTGVHYKDKIRVASCDVDVRASAGSTTISCPQVNTLIATGSASPSVGFYNGKPWVAYAHHLGTTPSPLQYAYEPTYNSPTWTNPCGAQCVPGNPNIYMPSVANDIPTGAITTNSTYIPTFWSPKDDQRLLFSTNMGGTVIGTVAPFTTANPILGYGWSPNLGWISMNCANKPDQNCTFPFGLGIGIAAHGEVQTPDRDQLPDLRYGTNVVLSPSSATTFPIGGYAWSPSAGFISLERRDSICPSTDTNCTTAPATPNTYGNPPGQAYNNAGASFTQNVPLAKYDTATQHVYGWARILSLCNFDSAAIHCKDKDAGWVRLRGYYVDTDPSTGWVQTVNATSTLQFTSDAGCSTWVTNDVITIQQYATNSIISGCSGTTVSINGQTPLPATGSLVVANATQHGGPYGVDAYWTGDHYELAGWAWSSDYGWIRFDPLIFLGYAWLETLFGNVYSVEGITLPNATDLSGGRFNTCGADTSSPLDGIGDEPCYVSTYRIESGGTVQALTSDGSTPLLDSAMGNIYKSPGTTCVFGAPGYDAKYCALQGSSAGDISNLQGLVSRGSSFGGLAFPNVGSTTTSYRNALGKLDVGGLTTIVGEPIAYDNFISSTKDFRQGQNRFGNTLYKTSLSGPNPVAWTVKELSGWLNSSWGSTAPVLPLNVTTADAAANIAPLRSQVIHVQGDLTVDGAETTLVNKPATYQNITITLTSTAGFPSNTQSIGSTSYASCAGCVIVIDPGGPNEEYFSYRAVSGSTLTGAEYIAYGCNSGIGCPHVPGEKVRFVWRLPYANNDPAKNIAQSTTIVVDGDLNIQYNIITADRSQDEDLSSTAAADTIRDLPTIAFVVKGNVLVDKRVDRLSGAYIVTSRSTSVDPDGVVNGAVTRSTNCSSLFSGCGGVFLTGDDNDLAFCGGADKTCNPLKIEGLLFARLFAFQRIGYLDRADYPAEQVTADERLFLNPPPGLEDVTKALPNPQRTLP